MNTSEKCNILHGLFNSMKLNRFEKNVISNINFPFGIYVIFEKNEISHDGNRIVYIGTTTGQKSTVSERIDEHYKNEGRSVFRNEIALCLLKKNNDPYYLSELFFENSIYRRKWKKNANDEQVKKYLEINNKVSEHIRTNCYFVVFPVEKEYREYWEKRIISTVSSCNICEKSKNWLGNYSPKDIIQKYGLWNIKNVNQSNIFTDSEFNYFINMVKNNMNIMKNEHST